MHGYRELSAGFGNTLAYPLRGEHFDLSQYDLIFSSSSGYAKGVRRRSDAVHVCYCHTPMRWVWRYEDYVARESFGGAARSVLPLCLWGLRKWDLRAAQQPNYYIANSHLVAERIKTNLRPRGRGYSSAIALTDFNRLPS